MSYKAYSFDVFDTLLTRNVSCPKDVFLLIQRKIKRDLSPLFGDLSRTYYGKRIIAEFWARRESSSEDICLTEIYKVMDRWCQLDSGQCEILIELELALEKQVLVPIEGAAEYVTSRRAKGLVVFISDMYLPARFIEAILTRFGIFGKGDKLYVSGEYGATKGTGTLYSRVLEDLNLNASQMLHLGDNPVSDYAVPISMGIGFDKTLGSPCGKTGSSIFQNQKVRYLFELLQALVQMKWGIDV